MQQSNSLNLAGIPTLKITTSVGFNTWSNRQNFSIVFTAYRAGKIFLTALQLSSRLSISERTFNRSMGLWIRDLTLYLSSLYQIWGFQNVLKPGESHNGYDALYVRQWSYITKDLDIPNLVVDRSFSNLTLNEKLRQASIEAICGLLVIDLQKGEIVRWLRISGLVRELYDWQLN